MQFDSTLFIQLLFLAFLIFLNAFFAASEVALISIKTAVLRKLKEKGGTRVNALAALHENSGRYLATVQIGVTLAGFLASAFAADSFARPVTEFLQKSGVSFFSSNTLENIVVILITLILSYLSLVFGELVPKQLALRYSETVALNAAPVINLLAKISSPFVWFLNASVECVLSIFGCRSAADEEITEEEIRMMVSIGEEKGVIEEDEKRIIENVFEFNSRTAGELMTHRTSIRAVDIDAGPEELGEALRSAGHSRIPVYHKDIDNIIGILLIRDYVSAKLSGTEKIVLRDIVKPAYLVPDTIRANILFRNMQKRKIGMAILLDEFGGTSGLVTMSDLLEEIVGVIKDEFDTAEDELFEVLSKDCWRVDGALRIAELNRYIGLSIPDDEYDTVNGFIAGKLNEIPAEGASVDLPEQHLKLTVESIAERRAGKIRITRTV